MKAKRIVVYLSPRTYDFLSEYAKYRKENSEFLSGTMSETIRSIIENWCVNTFIGHKFYNKTKNKSL